MKKNTLRWINACKEKSPIIADFCSKIITHIHVKSKSWPFKLQIHTENRFLVCFNYFLQSNTSHQIGVITSHKCIKEKETKKAGATRTSMNETTQPTLIFCFFLVRTKELVLIGYLQRWTTYCEFDFVFFLIFHFPFVRIGS